MNLTVRMKRFIELYDGNATQTAIKSGYSAKNAGEIGHQNYKKLKKYIDERIAKTDKPHILNRDELQAFWSWVSKNEAVDFNNRLRATELLGKSNAIFVEKIHHTGTYDVKYTEEMKGLFSEFRLKQRQTVPQSQHGSAIS